MVREWFRGLFKGADTAQETRRIIHTVPVGSSGTEIYSGYIYEDYLESLQGTEKAKVYDKMRKSDPQIKMCLSAVKAPILSASWDIQPFDQNEGWAREDADLVKHVLFDKMEKDFKQQFVKEALTNIEFGHSCFEIVDRVFLDDSTFGKPFNGIKNLSFRSQKTLQRWNVDKDTERLVSVSQFAYGDIGKVVDIPGDVLMVFSVDREGANYEGTSFLRCCYGNWFRKNNYLKLNAIGIEKFAIPTIIAEVPEGKENSPEFASLIQVLEKYQVHESNYLTKPAGWDMQIQANNYDPQKVEVSIGNEDARIVKAFLANFLELGVNGVGSHSLSFDLSDFFLKSLQHIADGIAVSFSKILNPRIVQMNSGNRPGYPKMTVFGISDKAGKDLAEVMDYLTRSKIITPDDILEEHTRKRYNLPERSLIGQRIVQPQQSFGSTPMLSEKVRKILRA